MSVVSVVLVTLTLTVMVTGYQHFLRALAQLGWGRTLGRMGSSDSEAGRLGAGPWGLRWRWSCSSIGPARGG